MATYELKAPWSNFFTQVATGQPIQSSGTIVYGHRTDNRTVNKSPKGLRKWRPPLPYSRYVKDGNSVSVHCNATMTGRYYRSPYPPRSASYSGPVSPSGIPEWPGSLPAFPSSMISRAEIRALKQLKDNNVNIALAFAERRRTADMLTENVLRLRKAVKAARRLDAPGIAESLGLYKVQKGRRSGKRRRELPSTDQRVHNLWLEFQYGWSPLLSDSKGAIEELAEDDLADPDRYRCTVIGKDLARSDIRSVHPGKTPNSGVGFVYSLERHERYVQKVKVRLDYLLSNPALAQASSLGLTNPLELAWELVPFSFVADWFLPIGSYLGALDASVGWTFLAGSRSTVTKRNVKGRCGNMTYPSPYLIDVKVGNGSPTVSFREASINRSIYGTSPLPRFPSIDGDLTRGQRFNNALALLIQAFR